MSKRNRSILLAVTLVIVAVATFGLLAFFAPQKKRNTEPMNLKPNEPEIDEAQLLLDTMTLDEKIAQLLIVQPSGLKISDAEKQRLETAPYGGYIFLCNNFGTLSATRDYIQQLQKLAKTPLIMSLDQEGGSVQRIKCVKDRSATNIPYMYDVGKTGDINYAKELGRVMAEEQRVLGFNVDFAPDADVYSNANNTVIGRRSFSTSPDAVSKMSLALAQGLEQNGVMAVYKHFPGHGNTTTDSHVSLPIIRRTRAQLDEVELVPFKNAIKNGAKAIMVGHIALPNITGDNTPATLSYKITTELLRNELGFDGLIFTDGVNMGALTRNYADADIYYRTIEAGADLIVLPRNPELAISSIKEHISESCIDESVYRILNFKLKYLSDYTYLDDSYFGSTEHQKSAKHSS